MVECPVAATAARCRCILPQYSLTAYANSRLKVVYLEYPRPLPRIPLVARQRTSKPYLLSPRCCCSLHGLRICSFSRSSLRCQSQCYTLRYALLLRSVAGLPERERPNRPATHNAPSNSFLLDLPTEDSTLLTPGLVRKKKSGKLVKGAFYGGQVFYSFFIMLLFMTYNGWVMIAVAVGAMLGYLVWGDDEPSGKSVACH
jgi:hypothetical protein